MKTRICGDYAALLWARGESNSHGSPHTLLKRTRLPISPRARILSFLCARGGNRTHMPFDTRF
jgi:hypothetical protein